MNDSVAAIIARMDHWAALDLGSDWQRAGEALAGRDTASASRAFIWARTCYSIYQAAWESSPSSRWDPDASSEIKAVDALLQKLYATPAVVDAALPPWAVELLNGILPDPLPETEESGLLKIATELTRRNNDGITGKTQD